MSMTGEKLREINEQEFQGLIGEKLADSPRAQRLVEVFHELVSPDALHAVRQYPLSLFLLGHTEAPISATLCYVAGYDYPLGKPRNMHSYLMVLGPRRFSEYLDQIRRDSRNYFGYHNVSDSYVGDMLKNKELFPPVKFRASEDRLHYRGSVDFILQPHSANSPQDPWANWLINTILPRVLKAA